MNPALDIAVNRPETLLCSLTGTRSAIMVRVNTWVCLETPVTKNDGIFVFSKNEVEQKTNIGTTHYPAQLW